MAQQHDLHSWTTSPRDGSAQQVLTVCLEQGRMQLCKMYNMLAVRAGSASQVLAM